MPRYYFHTEDGQCWPDEHGLELPDSRAILDPALRTMSEMSCALKDHIRQGGSLRVTVKDEADLTLMMIDLVVTIAGGELPEAH